MKFPITKAIVHNRTTLREKNKGMVCFLETPKGAIGTAKQIPMYTYSIMLLYIQKEI